MIDDEDNSLIDGSGDEPVFGKVIIIIIKLYFLNSWYIINFSF